MGGGRIDSRGARSREGIVGSHGGHARPRQGVEKVLCVAYESLAKLLWEAQTSWVEAAKAGEGTVVNGGVDVTPPRMKSYAPGQGTMEPYLPSWRFQEAMKVDVRASVNTHTGLRKKGPFSYTFA
eukprot:7264693-Pyramimonas_sp.AAC.1